MVSVRCRPAARELNLEYTQGGLWGALLGPDGENYERFAA